MAGDGIYAPQEDCHLENTMVKEYVVSVSRVAILFNHKD